MFSLAPAKTAAYSGFEHFRAEQSGASYSYSQIEFVPRETYMWKGFRDFILRGNVVDLAVAVVIGAAFTNIVNSLVKDIINPLIAATVKQPDFSHLYVDLHGGHIAYGNFVNAAISFLLIAASVYFLVVLPLNTLMKRLHHEAPPATLKTKPCSECLSEIPIAARRCSFCAQPVSVA